MFTRLSLALCFAMLITIARASGATTISNPDKTGGFLLAVPARALEAATLFEAIDKVKAAGGKLIDLEFGQKLSGAGGVFDEQLTDDQIKQLKVKLEGIKAVSATLAMGSDAKKNEKVFELAQKLGLTTLTVEVAGDPASWVPKEEGKTTALDRVRSLADKYDINVALVNTVKVEGARLWEPNYLLALVTNRTVRLGICADTRRFAQSGLDPLESLKALNGRVFACRVSDLEKGGDQPVVYGAGASDLKGMLVELKRQVFDGPLLIETATASTADKLAKCRDFVRSEGEKAAAAGRRAAEEDVRVLNGFRYEIIAQETVPEPMDLCFSSDGRLWVTGRDGHLWTINTVSLEQTLIGKLTLDKRGDYGLHGIDFDPEFPKNGHLYLFYSPKIDEQPHMRVSRFTITEQGRGKLDLASEKVLLEYTLAPGGQHVGGAVRYNPKDGKLYVSTGDNNRIVDLQKYFDDPDNQAQNLNDLRGKTLRLNLDGSIPTDNPYYNQPGKRGEIFTRGHRQAFSLHVDAFTGNVYEGENGGDRYEDFEEVNLLQPGGNYGWPRCIGNNLGTFGGTNPIPSAIKPWMTYPRFNGGSCVGGPFYRNTAGKYLFPAEFRNGLFYGDYNRKSVRFVRVDPATNASIKTEPFALNFGGGPVAVEAGPDGALYILEYGGWFRASQKDRVARIVYPGQ